MGIRFAQGKHGWKKRHSTLTCMPDGSVTKIGKSDLQLRNPVTNQDEFIDSPVDDQLTDSHKVEALARLRRPTRLKYLEEISDVRVLKQLFCI